MAVVQLVPYSFIKDFILVCSIGLNLGFIIGLLLLQKGPHKATLNVYLKDKKDCLLCTEAIRYLISSAFQHEETDTECP